MNLPICLSTVLVMRFPILAWISGSLRSGSALTDRFKFEFFRRGSADIDRLKLGLVCPGLRLGPLVPTVRPGDLRLVDILTLVWPPTGIVVWVVGLVVRRFGDGEGLDRRVVGLEEADLAFDAPSLKFSMKGWQGTTYFIFCSAQIQSILPMQQGAISILSEKNPIFAKMHTKPQTILY